MPKTIILSQMDRACFTVLATLQDRGEAVMAWTVGRRAGGAEGPRRAARYLPPPTRFWVGVLSTRKSVEQRSRDTAVSGHLPDLPVSLCLIFIYLFLPNFFILFLTEIFSSELQTFGQTTPITSISCLKKERTSPRLPCPGGVSGEAAARGPVADSRAACVRTVEPRGRAELPVAQPLLFTLSFLFQMFYNEQVLLLYHKFFKDNYFL